MSEPSTEGYSSFNLLDEAWIPCVRLDGAPMRCSVREVLARANEIRAIEAEIVTVTFAIHRLLVAVLYRAIVLDEVTDVRPSQVWGELWQEPTLPMDQIEDYLGKVQDRFDLLHPVAPFYQVADLHTGKNEFSGLEKIIADVPNGSPYFTTRAGDRLSSIDFAEAARWVVHCQAFDSSGIKSGAVGDPRVKGGKGYPMGTAWAGGIGGLLVQGDSLRDTLLLNVPLGKEGRDDGIWSVDTDRPVWERTPQSSVEEFSNAMTGDIPGRQPRGPADLLTWQSRRIRLRIESGQVTGVLIANGDVLGPQNRFGAEPMTGWRFSEPQTKKHKINVQMPRQHDPARAVWRGLGAILPHAEAAGGTADGRPGQAAPNLTWLQTLQRAKQFDDQQVRIRAIGMIYGSNNSVVDDVFDDSLRVHSVLISDRGLQNAALAALAKADDGVFLLSTLARNLNVAAGGDGTGARGRVREQGYFRLDAAYRQWVTRLAPGSDAITALTEWVAEARAALLDLAGQEIASVSPSAWAGRHDGNRHVDVGLASRWFTGELNKVLPAPGNVTREQQEVL